jgi:hypothetical protein
MEHLVLYVDCLGVGGVRLAETLHSDCLVQMSGAFSWLGRKGGKATRTLSRVFIDKVAQESTITELALQQAQLSCSSARTMAPLSESRFSQSAEENVDV